MHFLWGESHEKVADVIVGAHNYFVADNLWILSFCFAFLFYARVRCGQKVVYCVILEKRENIKSFEVACCRFWRRISEMLLIPLSEWRERKTWLLIRWRTRLTICRLWTSSSLWAWEWSSQTTHERVKAPSDLFCHQWWKVKNRRPLKLEIAVLHSCKSQCK